MSGNSSPTIQSDAERAKSLKAKLTSLFPDSLPHIDRCLDSFSSFPMPTPTSSSQNNSSGGVLPGGNVPMRVYFKSNVAAAHTYNTVAISPTALVRDVVKLLMTKNKIVALESKFSLILWKRSPDNVVDEQYLRDSERPATLIALWKSKGETDSTRRFYLYFSESIAAGLPRPEPYVPANEVSPTGDDESADSADGSHSPRGGALDTLRRGLSKLGSGGAGRKNKSGSLQTDDSSAAKSPPVSPRATPSSPKRAISPKPTAGVANSSAASILTSSAGAVPTPAMSTGRPNRSLTEAAALKTKVESPYRTIPSDLWDDADVADTSTAITTTTTTTTATAAAAASRVASSSPVVTRSVAPQSDDVKFLEQLLSQPSVGGVQDMRVLSTRDDDDEDDDGFRMSLIDRPNEEFLKEVKLGKTRSEHKPVAKQPQPAAKPAAAKPRASGGGDVDPLAELEQVWLEQQAEAESRAVAEDIERQSAYVRSQRERVADSAMAAIDDMLVGLNDDAGATVPAGTNTEPILMAIPAPAEHVEEEESPYNMIPKGLGRPSFQRPAGQDPAVFQAKVAAISRASSTRAPVEVEPAPEDVDELMRELAADENVQLAMSMTTQDLKALDQIKVEAAEEPQGETANAAAGAAAADEWDFEADLQKAQDELATHLAELNGI